MDGEREKDRDSEIDRVDRDRERVDRDREKERQGQGDRDTHNTAAIGPAGPASPLLLPQPLLLLQALVCHVGRNLCTWLPEGCRVW